MRDFYITLLSNSSMIRYPENKTSSFTVHIPRSMRLVGDWDVALAEIHYPYSFFTVQEDENEMEIKSFIATKEFIDTKGAKEPETKWTTLKITPGFYGNVKEIIHAVNGAIKKETKLSDFFEMDKNSKRVSVKGGNVSSKGDTLITAFKLRGRLALQLGYRPDDEVPADLKAPHVANIDCGVPDLMLIYCDVIEPQITGDSWSKVLRTLNTSDGNVNYFSKPCSVEFTQLHYIPLQKKIFDSVRIDIRDVTGKLLPFQYGTLTVKLHFIKR